MNRLIDLSASSLIRRLTEIGTPMVGSEIAVTAVDRVVVAFDGKLLSVLGPGEHQLTEEILPGLREALGSFPKPGEALPIDVYLVSLGPLAVCEWVAPNPIPYRDSEFDVVSMCAAGSYRLQVLNAGLVVESLVIQLARHTSKDIHRYVQSLVAIALRRVLADVTTPLARLQDNYSTLAEGVQHLLRGELRNRGLRLEQLVIEKLTPPNEIVRIIKGRTGRTEAPRNQQAIVLQDNSDARSVADHPAAAICSHCGVELHTIACHRCSAPVASEDRFCSACGEALHKS